MERHFAIALGLPMCGAGGPDAVPVCVDVDGLVSDEGAGKHAGGIDRCGVQGGSGESGVSDGESAGLDSVTKESAQFVVDGAGESGDGWEELRAESLFHWCEVWSDVGYRAADVLPLGAQTGYQACIGGVREPGCNGSQPFDPRDPSLDHRR